MRSTIRLRNRSIHLLRQVVAVALLAPLFVASSVAADTIRVPQDRQTVQAGIDAATAGDTVLVAAGTYKERIRLKPGITVKSVGDNAKGRLGLKRTEATIIDGDVKGAAGPGVAMAENSTLDGFTVTGVGKYDDAKWKKHHVTQGEEQSHEHIGQPGTAGIAVIGVTRCTVTNNIVHHIGYTGIAIMGAKGKRVAPHIVGNVTYRNMGGGIGSMKESTAVIEKNICFENFYAGIGHNNRFDVSAGIFSGINRASSACRGVRTKTFISAPRKRIRKPPGFLPTLTTKDVPSTSSTARLCPGVQSDDTRRLAPSAKETVAPIGSASITTGNDWPCSDTTQSLPTLRSWLSIRPDTRVRLISATRYIAAADAATRRSISSGRSTPLNPSGNSSSMNAVVILPEVNFS